MRHLTDFTGPEPDALLFAGRRALRSGGRTSRCTDAKATAEAGIPDLHFHDLRHIGNTWAAETGATLRDLMDRMGHSTNRAALIYLHRTAGRDRKIADALSKLVEEARGEHQADEGTEAHDEPEGHAEGTAAE